MKAGAKSDLANDRGWSPLFHGVSGNHVDISEILIAAGADLHRRSNTGDTGDFADLLFFETLKFTKLVEHDLNVSKSAPYLRETWTGGDADAFGSSWS